MLGVKLAIRRGASRRSVCRWPRSWSSPPASRRLRRSRPKWLHVRRSWRRADRRGRAAARSCEAPDRPTLDAGELGRVPPHPGHASTSRRPRASAPHDFAQSASVFDLLGERYQAALSQPRTGRLAAKAGARTRRSGISITAGAVFQMLGAQRDLRRGETQARRALRGGTRQCRLVGRRRRSHGTAAGGGAGPARNCWPVKRRPRCSRHGAMQRWCSSRRPAASFGSLPSAGCDATWRGHWEAAVRGATQHGGVVLTEPLGKDYDGRRSCTVAGPAITKENDSRRLRMFASVARQGFELCGARERPPQAARAVGERPLEPLLPGFICASAAMSRVARADPARAGPRPHRSDHRRERHGQGSRRPRDPRRIAQKRGDVPPLQLHDHTRELADSQLFGHRRGSFTGAVADQPGSSGPPADGTLFLDEIGDLPLDVQPKLLRFLEQGEVMPVGEARPQRGRRPDPRGHQRRPGATCGGGQVSRGPVLPAQRDSDPRATACGTDRRKFPTSARFSCERPANG